MQGDVEKAPFKVPVLKSSIAGNLWLPRTAPEGVVVVHPATATPQRFYDAFARFITGANLAAVTYDYRGTGASGDPRLHSSLRMRDWMMTDVPAVASWARQQLPGVPMYAVGHSVGGHALSLGFGSREVSRFVLVSCHIAATRRITSARERARVRAVLHLIGPVLSRTLGYMPGGRVGLGEDIPSAAMIEWGLWARHDGYLFDDASLDAAARASSVRASVLAVGASDDPWATPGQIDALASRLSSASVLRKTYSPAELGTSKLGHHGLLRRQVGEGAWSELITWLTDTDPSLTA